MIVKGKSYFVHARALSEGLLKKLLKFEIAFWLCVAHAIFEICEHLAVKLPNPHISKNKVCEALAILRGQLSEMSCNSRV